MLQDKVMVLPEHFERYTRQLMGDDRYERYLHSFEQEPPVSIRLNPLKLNDGEWQVKDGEAVPWCRHAYYLPRRPNFTFDPLLHAGCYYVQEAASMFLDTVLCQTLDFALTSPQSIVHSSQSTVHSSQSTVHSSQSTVHSPQVLDLCAAPGGKATLLRTALPAGTVLYVNEPVRQRAAVLSENICKWGWPDCIVTNAYPRDYLRSGLTFDIILCDVPCSGEGMFRKDEATIREWSPQNVEKCWRQQRDILRDAWSCLRAGGLLVYSTCTFNTMENEENVRWACQELCAEVLPVSTLPEWNITGSLLPGFDAPVYRFIPGITRSEGLFVCVLRKVSGDGCLVTGEGRVYPAHKSADKHRLLHPSPFTPHHPLHPSPDTLHQAPLTYSQAMSYLRGEALVLPADTLRGIVAVTFMGHTLGLAKNIGTRANNLYPKEWRIKTTHIPNDYEAILVNT